MTTTVIVAVALPPVLVAVTVYVAEDVIVVGFLKWRPLTYRTTDQMEGQERYPTKQQRLHSKWELLQSSSNLYSV